MSRGQVTVESNLKDLNVDSLSATPMVSARLRMVGPEGQDQFWLWDPFSNSVAPMNSFESMSLG